MKKTYIKPKATAVEIHQQLLYAVSGENQEWGAKRNIPVSEYEEDEEDKMKVKEAFIINW